MAHETLIRLGFFLGLFALFALAEAALPRRRRVNGRWRRWATNGTLTLLNSATLRLLALALPLLSVGAALDAARLGWGLFNLTAWPNWIEVGLAIVILDFAIWFQHLASHRIPLLWRLHRVHHADRDIDVSSAIRFHPFEIGLSMLYKIAVIYALGPAAIAVIIFEVMLNGCALFNHANLALSEPVDRWLRRVIVTPDMHRVHHSVRRTEHDSNYGFTLSIWDRLFRTYVAQPEGGHDGMTLGLTWQDDRPTRLGWSLWLPFRK
ncbi:sterol desaturase family protein [Pseudooceanicola sp.]|uniref:sterol desaturase family protein n=1 Tax=Pseudooceanicola sp. TaxID=1914328 RepID=UPI0026183438|nr:sterol desaturase family protein [Pseudooceanicola sp.]MDF1856942.1 sterol desaturase family protein [Pseudooceanicola sp.]